MGSLLNCYPSHPKFLKDNQDFSKIIRNYGSRFLTFNKFIFILPNRMGQFMMYLISFVSNKLAEEGKEIVEVAAEGAR